MPYRDRTTGTAPSPTRLGRPAPLGAIGVVGFVVGAVLATAVPVLAPLGYGFGVVMLGLTVVGGRRRGKALQALEGLPFPITHDRQGPIDATSYAAPIREVVVHLEQTIDGPTAESWCRDAQASAPGLSAMARGDSIVLGGWPWGKQDLDLLVALLSTWGRRLHERHGIRAVDVTWALPTGPKQII